LVLEITLDNENIVQKINKYSNKDSFEIKVSRNEDDRNLNLTGFFKDIIRALRRTKTVD